MRFAPSSLGLATLAALLGTALGPSVHAQTFAAATGTATSFSGDIPSTAPSALPSHHKKSDAPLIYARVRNGIYSVDGMVGKVQLNYDIKGANFLYLFVPGVGTALVSLAPSPDAVAVPGVYENSELTLHIANHTLNLTGVESLVNQAGKAPAKVFVHLDRESWKLSPAPMMGFGTVAAAPYEWPGALPTQAATEQPAAIVPTPVPVSLLPKPVSFHLPANTLH